MTDAEFASALQRLGVELRPGLISGFDAFQDRLYASNEVMNLTRVPSEECRLRHFLDSLLFHDLIAVGSSVLDVGAGPGFPAWPLAWARPDLRVTALDSSGKMIRFLEGSPLPNLAMVQGRAEEWGVRERFDFVTGRALAPFGIQLELSAPACRLGGLVGPMRTPNERGRFPDEVPELGLRLEAVHEREAPGGFVRAMPLYRKVSAVQAKYPRAWAEIKRKPLI